MKRLTSRARCHAEANLFNGLDGITAAESTDASYSMWLDLRSLVVAAAVNQRAITLGNLTRISKMRFQSHKEVSLYYLDRAGFEGMEPVICNRTSAGERCDHARRSSAHLRIASRATLVCPTDVQCATSSWATGLRKWLSARVLPPPLPVGIRGCGLRAGGLWGADRFPILTHKVDRDENCTCQTTPGVGPIPNKYCDDFITYAAVAFHQVPCFVNDGAFTSSTVMARLLEHSLSFVRSDACSMRPGHPLCLTPSARVADVLCHRHAHRSLRE
jgi:hypothetical protein